MVAPNPRTPLTGAGLLVLLVVLSTACGKQTWSSSLADPGSVPDNPGDGTVMTAHMHSGEMYVLNSWAVPDPGDDLLGTGHHYDVERTLVGSGNFTVPREGIALLESSRPEVVGRLGWSGLVAYTTLWGIQTARCVADPKSCFGSCPTFYGDDPDRPLAEGFSASFARALEERDVDALGLRKPPGPVSLTMRNEAWETHAVRHARLQAVDPRGYGEVLRDPDGGFHGARHVERPVSCRASGVDCLAQVTELDDVEYRPLTDGEDLAAREEVVLDFGPARGRAGVVLSARASLVTTYVFYQSLAWAGRDAGRLLAALERGDPGARERVLAPARALGGIEVSVREAGGEWRPMGVFDEAGPIAADRTLLFDTLDDGPVQVKLRMARGSWRIDQVGLAGPGEPLEPVTLELDSVTVAGAADAHALGRLADPEAHLVTVPGDAHRLWYTVPPGGPRELFLDTEGFYYEWMREAWLAEEDPRAARALMLAPAAALRALAPLFKEREEGMERLFWSSRFRR